MFLVYLDRHPEGRERASAFFSLRVALRDLLFNYGKGVIRLHDGQHFTPCAVYRGYSVPFCAHLAAQKRSGGYFTTKYKCYRLIYFEQFTNVEAAIAREKEIKGWRREKKNKLVESVNPGWKDLAADWYPEGLLKDGIPVDFSKTKA
jgi:predicted GIY-YIG superfamily endonuclease